MGNLRSHNTSSLYHDRILDWNCICKLGNQVDSMFDICTLQTLVCIGKGRINLVLNIAGFVDKIHQLPDQDVSFFVHQIVALLCQCQRIFGKHQISFCGKCTRIHEIPPFI